MKAKKWQLIQLKIWNVSNVYARWVNIFLYTYNFNNCDWFNGNFEMKKNIIYIIDWNKRCAGRLDSSSYLKCTNNIWVNYPIEIITQRGEKKNHCNIKSKVYSHLSLSKAIKLLENFSGTNKRLYQCNKSALILHCMCDNSNEILL